MANIFIATYYFSLEEEQEKKCKSIGPSSKQSEAQSQTSVEKSPVPSPSTTEQSSTISDHTSTTSECEVFDGLGEGSDIM